MSVIDSMDLVTYQRVYDIRRGIVSCVIDVIVVGDVIVVSDVFVVSDVIEVEVCTYVPGMVLYTRLPDSVFVAIVIYVVFSLTHRHGLFIVSSPVD